MKIITLKQICTQRKVPPKIARSRLRRAIPNDPRLQPLKATRWEWDVKLRSLVEKVIAN